jgi:hypothetical protein
MKKTTVHLDDDIHRLLKMRAAAGGENISSQINEALRRSLEEDRVEAAQALRRFHKERTKAIPLDEARRLLRERGLL